MGSSRLKKRTDGVDVDLDSEYHRFEFYMMETKGAHLDTKFEVVFRATRHDAMQAVNSVGDTELGSEKCLDLSLVAQIGLDDDCLGACRSLGLNDIGKDEMNIGGERIVMKGGGEL